MVKKNIPYLFLGNPTCIVVLDLFSSNPELSATQKDVQEQTGISKVSSIKWLKFLRDNNFIKSEQLGGRKFFRLNKENAIVKHFRILLLMSKYYSDFRKIETLDEIYLFGSAARGENDKISDVDILVIGEDRSTIGKIKAIDDKIKVSFYTPVEWAKMSREDKAFFERVEKDKIRLI